MSPEKSFNLDVSTINILFQRVSHKERLYCDIKKIKKKTQHVNMFPGSG